MESLPQADSDDVHPEQLRLFNGDLYMLIGGIALKDRAYSESYINGKRIVHPYIDAYHCYNYLHPEIDPPDNF